jgi:hypothetical protein
VIFELVRDIQHSANVLDIEQRIARRNRWVAKTAGKRGGRKSSIKDIDLALVEIGGIEEIRCSVVTDLQVPL